MARSVAEGPGDTECAHSGASEDLGQSAGEGGRAARSRPGNGTHPIPRDLSSFRPQMRGDVYPPSQCMSLAGPCVYDLEVKMKVASVILTLCDPMDCSLPGSSVHGILQAHILERVALPPPGDLPDTGIKPMSLVSLTLAGGFFTTSTTWHPYNLI